MAKETEKNNISPLQGKQDKGMLYGNLVSITAALIIAYLLLIVYRYGFEMLFRNGYFMLMIVLVALGVLARYFYMDAVEHAERVFKDIAPWVLLLAFTGVLLGYKYPLYGGSLIVLSYFLELPVAYALFREFQSISIIGASLFLAGIIVFGVSLPLTVYTREIAIAPLLGDIIKTLGLLLLVSRILHHKTILDSEG